MKSKISFICREILISATEVSGTNMLIIRIEFILSCTNESTFSNFVLWWKCEQFMVITITAKGNFLVY